MKRILASLLITTCISTAFANENDIGMNSYFCKESYQKKLKRIDENGTLRTVGMIMGTVVLGSAALATFAITMAPAPLIAIPGGYISALPSSSLFDREEGLIAATKVFTLSEKSREELKVEFYERFVDMKKSQLQWVETNDLRKHIEKKWPYSTFSFSTLMDTTLEKLNKKRSRKGLDHLSYEEYRLKLLDNGRDNTFCPLNINNKPRPVTLGKVIRIIAKQQN